MGSWYSSESSSPAKTGLRANDNAQIRAPRFKVLMVKSLRISPTNTLVYGVISFWLPPTPYESSKGHAGIRGQNRPLCFSGSGQSCFVQMTKPCQKGAAVYQSSMKVLESLALVLNVPKKHGYKALGSRTLRQTEPNKNTKLPVIPAHESRTIKCPNHQPTLNVFYNEIDPHECLNFQTGSRRAIRHWICLRH